MPVDVIHYSPGFLAYGTPCGENVDPAAAKLCEVENELAALRQEVAELKAMRQAPPSAKSA